MSVLLSFRLAIVRGASIAASTGEEALCQFIDTLHRVLVNLAAVLDELDAPLVLGERLFEPDLAAFDAVDDGLDLLEGVFERQIGGVVRRFG